MTELKKSIGFVGLIALGAAGVIGSSWIYTNSSFFSKYGAGGEIFGLAIATIIAIFIALAYAELATIFPRAGGEVVYTYVAFGKKTAFVAGWALIATYLSCLAFYVTASSLLLEKIFPQIAQGPYYTIAGTQVHLTELLIGISITIIIFMINYFGASLASGIQKVMFFGLIAIGVVLLLVGFSQGSASNFWPPFSSGQSPSLSMIRFMLPAMTFLTGFELVAVLAEEANMTTKKIGKAVMLSVLVAGSFYVLVLLSSAWIYPWTKTAELSMGTIDAFTAAGYPILGNAAFAISILGLTTSFIGLFAAAPRLVISLARANLLPKTFAKVHPKYGTPANATWLVLAFTIAFGCLGKSAMIWFLDMGGFAVAIAWVLTVVSLPKIRNKYPNLHGAFRVSKTMFPLVILGGLVAIAVAVSTIIPGTPLSLVWPYEYAILAVWAIAGFVLYNMSDTAKVSEEENLKQLLGEQYATIQPEEAMINERL